jgi:hypothetical protein
VIALVVQGLWSFATDSHLIGFAIGATVHLAMAGQGEN